VYVAGREERRIDVSSEDGWSTVGTGRDGTNIYVREAGVAQG
jgi:hypothetical protein